MSRRTSRARKNAPTRQQQQPVIEVGSQLQLNFEKGILQIGIPLRVNGAMAMVPIGIDITKIPEEEWRKMQESRSGLFVAGPNIKILR